MFLYGWTRDILTDSSNRAVTKVVDEIIVDKDGGKVRGPEIWLGGTCLLCFRVVVRHDCSESKPASRIMKLLFFFSLPNNA